MNERGQVFTLDMFFALALTALLVSYSGLAIEQVNRRAEDYALRYSLERTANDAADVLVRTLGMPDNWHDNFEYLESLGLAEENGGVPIPNKISVTKFGQLMRLLMEDNWETYTSASYAVKSLFGGSEKFSIRIIDENGDVFWDIWPRWDTENSGVENSLDVAVARRLATVRYGTLRAQSGKIVRYAGQPRTSIENVVFEIYEGELELFDWYIIVRTGSGAERIESADIYVNRVPSASSDYHFKRADAPEQIYPNEDMPAPKFVHGGIENDPRIDADDNLFVGTNSLGIELQSGPGGWIQIFVVGLPACSNWQDAGLALDELPATVEVKVWR